MNAFQIKEMKLGVTDGWYGMYIPDIVPVTIKDNHAEFPMVVALGAFRCRIHTDFLRPLKRGAYQGYMLIARDTVRVYLSTQSKGAFITFGKLREIVSYVPPKTTQAPQAAPSAPVAPAVQAAPKAETVACAVNAVTPSMLQSFTNTIADVRIEGAYMPMPHQYQAGCFKALCGSDGRAFDLSTMRTGKTGSTILAMEYLLRTGAVKHVLVLAPLSCVRPVWSDALALTLPRRVTGAVVGTKAQRRKVFDGYCEILCSNFESLALFPEEWRAFKPDLIVVDECTHYANHTSKRFKAFTQFVKDVKPSYVWGLTGTPGHDPLKAWCMSKAINPNAVKCNSLTGWQAITQYKWGPQAWQWKNNKDAPMLIKQALSPSVLFKKDDLFNLPPVVYIAREAEQSSQQRKLMEQLRGDMIAVADSGEVITAQQKSVLVSKLLQCACGAVYGDDHEAIKLDIEPRVNEIEALIKEATGKTVIFSAFTGCIAALRDELDKRGYKVAVVDGSTPERKRSDIFTKFQYAPKGEAIDVLIAHPRTTAFGIELSAADMMVFDGAPLSGDFVFGQAVERLSSTKQKSKQITIAQVYCSREERTVFKALREGQSESAIVADLFTSVTERTKNLK